MKGFVFEQAGAGLRLLAWSTGFYLENLVLVGLALFPMSLRAYQPGGRRAGAGGLVDMVICRKWEEAFCGSPGYRRDTPADHPDCRYARRTQGEPIDAKDHAEPLV